MTSTVERPVAEEQRTEFHELHVETLAEVGDNIRAVGDVAELAASIKTNGLIEPIIATLRATSDDEGVRFVVVAGHRRLAAAKLAGLETVPVIVRTMDEQQRVAAMLVENLQREDLTPLEEARAYKRLADEFGLTQRQLAEQVSRSQGHISKRLTLLDLPDEVREQVDSGGITIADAVELAKLKDAPERLIRAAEEVDGWGGVARAVETQLEAMKRAKQVDVIAAKLEKAGKRVVRAVDDDGWNLKLPKGVFKITRSTAGYDYDALIVDPTKHESEECHAITINPRNLDEIAVCTNRKNHPKAKTVRQKLDENRGSGVTKSTTKPEGPDPVEEAEKARLAFTTELFARKAALPKATMLDVALRGMLEMGLYDEGADFALVALGLAKENDSGMLVDAKGKLLSGTSSTQLLMDYVEGGSDKLLRACTAIAFGQAEAHGCDRWRPKWTDAAATYVGLLEQNGYEVTAEERKHLPKAPRAAA